MRLKSHFLKLFIITPLFFVPLSNACELHEVNLSNYCGSGGCSFTVYNKDGAELHSDMGSVLSLTRTTNNDCNELVYSHRTYSEDTMKDGDLPYLTEYVNFSKKSASGEFVSYTSPVWGYPSEEASYTKSYFDKNIVKNEAPFFTKITGAGMLLDAFQLLLLIVIIGLLIKRISRKS